jgi:hypothetical protein
MIDFMAESPMFFESIKLMISRFFLMGALLPISLLLFTGCDLKIKDKAPVTGEISFEDEKKVKCISKTIPYFEAFLRGDPDGAKVKEFWDCSTVAIQAFRARARGLHDGSYSAKSMSVFLEKYFLDDMEITDSLIEEAMRLKQIFLGGSLRDFSLKELDQLVLIFSKMGDLTGELFPFMVLYTGRWKPKAGPLDQRDLQYVENGSAALDKLVSYLISQVNAGSPAYPMDNFLVFLQEFDQMMKNTVDFSSPIEKLLPVLKKLKVILAAGQAGQITPHEWGNFLTLGSKGYMIFLRWDLYLNRAGASFTEEIWSSTRILDDSFILVAELLSNRGAARISAKDLFDISLEFHEIYPEFVTSQKIIEQLMLFKKSLLGSSAEFWDSTDFQKARDKLQALKDLSLRLLPYMDLLLDKWQPDSANPAASREFIVQAISVLRLAKEKFSSLWSEAYDWNNITQLIDELTVLYPKKIELKELKGKWSGYLQVFLSLKKVLIADDSTVVSGEQWRQLLDPALKLFEIFKLEKYFPSNEQFLSGGGLDYWHQLLQSVFTELEGSVKLRFDGKIATVEFENLIKVLGESKLIKTPQETLVSLFRNLMEIKKSFLNTSSEMWTADDFARMRPKLTNLKEMVKVLLPHLDIYFGKARFKVREITADKKSVKNAFSILQNSIRNGIGLIEGTLDLAVIDLIVRNLEEINPNNSEIKELRLGWDQYFPVVISLKRVLTGEEGSLVDVSKLKIFLEPALNLFELFTVQKYFPNRQKIFLSKASLEYWSDITSTIFSQIESSLKVRAKARIQVTEIESFLKVLDKAGLTKTSYRASVGLFERLMEVKRAFLGTSSDFWTAQDIARIKPKLSFVKDFVIEVLPYLDIIKGKWIPNTNDSANAKEYLHRLFLILDIHRQGFTSLWEKSFDWSMVPVILSDLIKVFPKEDEIAELAEKWALYFPTVVASKQVITGSDSVELDSKAWESFYTRGLNIYELFLNYKYFVSRQEFLNKKGFESWNKLLVDSIYQLELVSKARGEIPLKDVENFIETLEKSKLIKVNFDKRLIGEFGPLLLKRYLIDPRSRSRYESFEGVSPTHFDFMMMKWRSWVDAQRFLFDLSESLDNEQIGLKEFHTKVSKMAAQYKAKNALSLAVSQIKDNLLAPQNLFLNSEKILTIANSERNQIFAKISSMTYLNNVRAMVEMAFIGYLSKSKSFLASVSEDEFEIFIKELMPLLKRMGWLRKAKETFAASRFLEGNLFTPSANGDEELSFQEGVELVVMLISGVARSRELVMKTNSQCHPDTQDFASIDCYRTIFYENRKSIYEGMPFWLKFEDGLSRNENAEFNSYLEQGAEAEASGDEIYVPDLMLLTNLAQYIEMVFTRFNTNFDSILDTNEAMNAYPVFRGLLTQLSKLDDPTQVRAVFAYILKYGKVPDRSIGGMIEFVSWSNNSSSWDLRVDRKQLAKIFNFIQNEKKQQKKLIN